MARRSGPPYRRIVVTFWNDPDVKRVLSLEEKAFLAYLFSNEHSHPCGLYRLPPIHVLDELGIDQDRMKELLEGPIAPFATYDWRTEEIFVHNMAEHQIDGPLRLKTDNRIRWIVTQLEMIHSQALLHAFRERYPDWSLPWEDLIEPGEPPKPENPRGSGTTKGVRRGFEGGPNPLPEPGMEDFRRNIDDSEDPDKMAENQEAPSLSHDEGGSKGVRSQTQTQITDPDPDPAPEEAIQPPAQSSGETLGADPPESAEAGRREVGSNEEAHPSTDELWTADVRQAVVDVWHQGSERIEIHGTDRGLGAEYLAASDVLKATDGDVELVRWLIVEAPRAMGWDSEPRSLRWLAQGPNLEEAIAEYHRRHSGRNAQTAAEVEVKRAPDRRRPGSELQAEAKRKLAELQAREAG